MEVFQEKSRVVVTCNRGLAPCVAKELQELGHEITGQFNTGVETTGTMSDCVRMNLRLRCASQVMYSLRQFTCRDPEELYRNVRQIPWELLIDSEGYFTVNCNVSHETIRSTMFASVKVKDAIVDRIRAIKGHRPDSGSEPSGTVIYLYWRGPEAEIFLDTSGETLAKHSYRRIPGKAPMVEALAAGVVLSSRWDHKSPVVNPMCGSGTLAIEAALIATKRYPGMLRSEFAFQHVLGYDATAFLEQRKQLQDCIEEVEDLKIIASDIDNYAVRNARTNAQAAGVAKYIEFSNCDFRDTTIPQTPGILLFNPEYGERLGDQTELVEVYAEIGTFMKHKCGGYWGYVFTGNMELGKRIGLKPKRKIEFVTAQLDCRLLEFELYAGSKKTHTKVVEDASTEPSTDVAIETEPEVG